MNSRARQLICILLIMMGSHAHAQFAGLQVGRIQPLSNISYFYGNSWQFTLFNQSSFTESDYLRIGQSFEFSPLSVRSDTFNIVYFDDLNYDEVVPGILVIDRAMLFGLSVFVDGCPYQPPGIDLFGFGGIGARFGWFSMSYTRDYYGGTAAPSLSYTGPEYYGGVSGRLGVEYEFNEMLVAGILFERSLNYNFDTSEFVDYYGLGIRIGYYY